MLRVAKLSSIHRGKTPMRLHFIPEWAAHRGLKQTDIVAEMGVDKSTVSRWFKGSLPLEKHLIPLAGVLSCEEATALFRHPDDDWIARFFRSRREEERERAIRLLETAFPDRQSTAA